MKLKSLFLKDENANIGTIILLITAAVGILALAIILTLGPSIGYSLTTAASVPASSQWAGSWNTTGNASGVTISTGALNGSQLWVNTTPMLGSGAMVVIAAMIIAVLLGAFIFGRRR